MKLIVGFFTTKPGKREEYLAAVEDHLVQSRLEPGRNRARLHAPDKLLLVEAFVPE